MRLRLPTLCLPLVLLACSQLPKGDATTADSWDYVPDVEVTRAPYREVHANWKQRMAQPYAFIEHQGSYTGTGRLLPTVLEAVAEQGLEISGPPFALFYDDPGTKAIPELRSRACVPIAAPGPVTGALQTDTLKSTTVVYGLVSGPYPEVPRSYAGLFEYMGEMGWVEDGPIREIYIVSPGEVESWDELLCEVQIPAAYAE